jgi:hypothetical protein
MDAWLLCCLGILWAKHSSLQAIGMLLASEEYFSLVAAKARLKKSCQPA